MRRNALMASIAIRPPANAVRSTTGSIATSDGNRAAYVDGASRPTADARRQRRIPYPVRRTGSRKNPESEWRGRGRAWRPRRERIGRELVVQAAADNGSFAAVILISRVSLMDRLATIVVMGSGHRSLKFRATAIQCAFPQLFSAHQLPLASGSFPASRGKESAGPAMLGLFVATCSSKLTGGRTARPIGNASSPPAGSLVTNPRAATPAAFDRSRSGSA